MVYDKDCHRFAETARRHYNEHYWGLSEITRNDGYCLKPIGRRTAPAKHIKRRNRSFE